MEFFKRTFLRFIFVFFLYSELVNAMTLDKINGDMPRDFAEIMPIEFIDCAKLAIDSKFNDVTTYWINLNKENDGFAQEISAALARVYDSAKEEYLIKRKSLCDDITERDFVYNQLLRYFWWSHYYPVYEGLI